MKHRCQVLCILLMMWALIGILPAMPTVDQASADVVLIANQSVSASSISKEDVKKIFTNKKVKWDDGNQIVVATLKEGAAHKDFLDAYLSKSPSQFWAYWRKQMFTGQGSLPKQFDSEKEALDYVAGMEGAIGYVSAGTPANNVKVLSITD